MDSFLGDDFLKEIQEKFLSTLKNRIEKIRLFLAEAKKSGLSKENFWEVYRILHTIKGTAAMLGLRKIATLSHKIENIFSVFSEKDMQLPPEIHGFIFRYLNLIETFRERHLLGQPIPDLKEMLGNGLLAKERKKVLLTENSRSFKKYIKNGLVKNGFESILAAHPLEALTRILAEPVDVLITSQEFSILDGLNLIRMVKAHEEKKKIQTILLTSEDIQDPAPDLIVAKSKGFFYQILEFISRGTPA